MSQQRDLPESMAWRVIGRLESKQTERSVADAVGVARINSPSKQNRECYAAAKTVALGNKTKGVQPNST
ncbi:hypothetical protein TNCV_2747671 [Trichonephila clavipes]|nr:hypothetical protein TNCV_2747671 [Trichonephila clavipes]